LLDIGHPIHYEINTDDDLIRKAAGLTGIRRNRPR
jgi:hypothetical protein